METPPLGRLIEQSMTVKTKSITRFLSLTVLILAFLTACNETSTSFMDALETGEDTTAFNLLDADLQEELGGRDGFGQWANEWRPASFSFGGSCSTNLNLLRSYGAGTLTDGTRFFMNLHLYKVDDAWVIQGIDVSGPVQDQLWGTSSNLSCDD